MARGYLNVRRFTNISREDKGQLHDSCYPGLACQWRMFGMFADTSTGSLCAAIVTEIAAAKQSTAQIRVVIGTPFG